MSSIISSIPASVTGYISGGAALTTIILCYVLAVSLGHVQPWLPMISDCGVLPPECFLFRAGLVLAAAALSVQVVSVFNAERDTTRSKAALAFGLLSAVGLAIIGVVSEKESSGAHTGFAVATLLFTEIYMLLMAWLQDSESRPHQFPIIVQRLCACYCAVAIILAAILSGISFKKYQVYIALCEWTGVATICIFLMVLDYNLSNVEFWEVCKATEHTNRKDVEQAHTLLLFNAKPERLQTKT